MAGLVWELRFTMYQLPVALVAVIETGTWTTEEVRSWADDVIQIAAAPASWLWDLGLARSHQEASAAAMRALEEAGVVLPDDFSELMIGLLYLRLQRDELSREQFVAEVGDVVDAYQASVFDVERWTRDAVNLDHSAPLRAELGALGARASDVVAMLKDTTRAARNPFIAGGPGG